MQNFLNVQEMNRKQDLNRMLKHLQTVASVFIILFVIATSMVGAGVCAKLVWTLLKWGWGTF